MLISANNNLNLILQDLALHPSAQVQEILRRLEAQGARLTRQAIHRNLALMKDMNVVVSEGGRYSLKLSWIIGARKFMNDVSLRYFGPEVLSQIRLDVGESKEWRFQNMIEMDSFGCHIDLALLSAIADDHYFAWEPYPWYVPFAPEQEESFASAMRAMKKVRSLVIGGNTFLHMMRSALGNDDVFRIRYDQAFPKDNGVFEYLYGSYILEVFLPDETTVALERLHISVTSGSAFDLGELRKIVAHNAGDVVLRLWNNPEEAERRREVYQRAFRGV